MWKRALRQWAAVEGRRRYQTRPTRNSATYFKDSLGRTLQKPRFDKIRLEPFEKNLYVQSEITASRSPREVEAFLAEHDITIRGNAVDVPKPVLTIGECSFLGRSQELFVERGFTAPTPIQAQAWPIVVSGRDLVGIAQTGSGKTLAYALPGALHASHQRRRGEGPIAVVLAPTRELVQQIHGVMRDWCDGPYHVRSVPVYGGASRNVQVAALQRGAHMCVATPGRLLDLLEAGALHLQRCSFLVLDEADRMLDMGFEPQIRKIVEQTRPDRQTVMWSATWPEDVRALALDFLRDFVQINVGSVDLCANRNVRQVVRVCSATDKERELLDVLNEAGGRHKTLVFAATKARAARLVRVLLENGFRAACTHGDLSQSKRDAALERFRSGETPVLVATDVASRGLDVADIEYVVNYDYPNTSEDYVHRIGRTGRADRTGTAVTLFTHGDAGQAKKLVRVLKEAGQEVNPELYRMADLHGTSRRPWRPRSYDRRRERSSG